MVSSSAGVTFDTGLLAEQIELKRTECDVGTTVVIQVTPQMIETLRKANWDWFCLTEPIVARIWIKEGQRERLEQSRRFAACGQLLTTDWRRLSSSSFADVQWTFSNAPNLICNGIEIRELTNERQTLADQIWRATITAIPFGVRSCSATRVFRYSIVTENSL